jgi:hypothetical protein
MAYKSPAHALGRRWLRDLCAPACEIGTHQWLATFFTSSMARSSVDEDGTECAGMAEVRRQAIETAGEILRDKADKYQSGQPWQMHVSTEDRKTVYRLNFSAEDTPTG